MTDLGGTERAVEGAGGSSATALVWRSWSPPRRNMRDGLDFDDSMPQPFEARSFHERLESSFDRKGESVGFNGH
jgi:hypothetical protein